MIEYDGAVCICPTLYPTTRKRSHSILLCVYPRSPLSQVHLHRDITDQLYRRITASNKRSPHAYLHTISPTPMQPSRRAPSSPVPSPLASHFLHPRQQTMRLDPDTLQAYLADARLVDDRRQRVGVAPAHAVRVRALLGPAVGELRRALVAAARVDGALAAAHEDARRWLER